MSFKTLLSGLESWPIAESISKELLLYTKGCGQINKLKSWIIQKKRKNLWVTPLVLYELVLLILHSKLYDNQDSVRENSTSCFASLKK